MQKKYAKPVAKEVSSYGPQVFDANAIPAAAVAAAYIVLAIAAAA